MGLLSAGQPLTWEETKQASDFIREHGIQQFINVYNRHQAVKQDPFRWGDEIEYTLVKFDRVNKTVHLALRAAELLPILQQINEVEKVADWKPEYSDYMVEGTPYSPFEDDVGDLAIAVEANMAHRRRAIEKVLGEDEAVITIPAFPRIGLPGFTFPVIKVNPGDNAVSASLFYPDRAIYQHPRFPLLTRNIRQRRGRKVAINIPIYRDEKTEDPVFVENPDECYDEEAKHAAKPNHVYMDCHGFGMGLSCLQVTFQGPDIDETRFVYDQLANICPLLLALTAATPVLRGVLTATDTRWQTISQAVDDRTSEESGEVPQTTARFIFPKSRYDSIDDYLSLENEYLSDLQPYPINASLMAKMTSSGIDHVLARHVAHLFCRDPITAYKEKMNLNDEVDTDHFENIQSTNWQTLRFKPPPSQPHADLNDKSRSRIGWRIEIRPMEIQMTDFENTAFSVFVMLLTRAILRFRLRLVIPLRRVDENMTRSHLIDAVLKQKFYFRTNVFPAAQTNNSASEHFSMAELTVDQIVNGCADFYGLVPLCNRYIDANKCGDNNIRLKLSSYLELISGRANGRYKTNARWMRDFITGHPDYQRDSRVSEIIQYDMLEQILAISQYKSCDNTLLPDIAMSKP